MIRSCNQTFRWLFDILQTRSSGPQRRLLTKHCSRAPFDSMRFDATNRHLNMQLIVRQTTDFRFFSRVCRIIQLEYSFKNCRDWRMSKVWSWCKLMNPLKKRASLQLFQERMSRAKLYWQICLPKQIACKRFSWGSLGYVDETGSFGMQGFAIGRLWSDLSDKWHKGELIRKTPEERVGS